MKIVKNFIRPDFGAQNLHTKKAEILAIFASNKTVYISIKMILVLVLLTLKIICKKVWKKEN